MTQATGGPQGTFVMSWAQTELDGIPAAPVDLARIGATWAWSGQAMRLDETTPEGDPAIAAIRQRAATGVRRLLRLPPGAITPPYGDAPPDRALTVTDGRQTWTLTLISAGASKDDLLMVLGDLPPARTELWIVSHTLDTDPAAPAEQPAGGVICFTPGTMILTDQGPVRVETLQTGHRLQTKDNGLSDILWTGHRRITGARLHAMPHLTPIRLREGALDRGVPDSGLLVSPDHRLVLKGPRARALFNNDEVLVAARDLIDGHLIAPEFGRREVTYIHLLLPRHEIILANGVETDSFHPAAAGPATLDDSQLAAMLAHLPGPADYGPFARRVLTAPEAAILRHAA